MYDFGTFIYLKYEYKRIFYIRVYIYLYFLFFILSGVHLELPLIVGLEENIILEIEYCEHIILNMHMHTMGSIIIIMYICKDI